MVLALVYAFATPVQAQTSRDLGIFTIDDANRFGNDMAYNSPLGGDRDADTKLSTDSVFETRGLHGTYSYFSGQGGAGN